MADKPVENPEKKTDKINYATSKTIADILKVTEYDIKTFVRNGMPRAGYNKFIPMQCFSWYIDYLRWKNEHWTVDDIASVVGVTPRTIQNWVLEKHIPKKERGAYNVRSTIAAWLKDVNEKHSNVSGEKNLNKSRQRLIDMQGDLKEIELLEKQETLIPKQLAQDLITEFATIVDKKLNSLPGLNLNKLFAAKSKEEILKVQKENIHKIKTEIALQNHKLNGATANK